jgi:hypothetical protein
LAFIISASQRIQNKIGVLLLSKTLLCFFEDKVFSGIVGG